MTIEKVNKNLPRQDQIDDLNDMVMELEGLVEQGKFDKNELDIIAGKLNARKYLRNVGLGNTSTLYGNWSHLQAESGFSIWKIIPATYTHNSLNKLYLDNKILSNKGEADSETATSFDAVYLFNAESGDAGAYTDNTTEAGTEGGSEFELMDSTSDYVYVGEASTFAGSKFEFQTRGSNYTLKVEYYSSITGWTELTADVDNLADNTSNFEGDGRIIWDIPTDWGLTTIKGTNKYWIRFSTTTTPTTIAKAYYIIPGDSVISLLALSSEEIANEDWGWCSYDGTVYVTIRNSGNSTYEGDYFITSSSSATNLQNYFAYNHQYTIDYESSLFNEVVTKTADYVMQSTDSIVLVDASSNDVTITLPVASENEGKRVTIKVKALSSGTAGVFLDCQSGETVDGEAGKTLKYENEFVTLVSDGADWWIIADKTTN